MNVVTSFSYAYCPILSHLADEALPMDIRELGVRVNTLGKRRQVGKFRKGQMRWLVSTGTRLIGSLAILVVHESLCDLPCLLKRGWAIDLYALLIRGAMVTLNKGILIWSMGRTDVRFNA